MDHRREELKVLKKASQKVKRKKTAVWKTIAVISLIFTLLLAPASLVVSVFDGALSALFGDSFRLVTGMIGAASGLIRLVVGILVVIFAVFLILWVRGERQWKRSQEYLDYKTLKTALELEKNEK